MRKLIDCDKPLTEDELNDLIIKALLLEKEEE